MTKRDVLILALVALVMTAGSMLGVLLGWWILSWR